MEAIIRQIYMQAKLLDVCDKFTGLETTLDDIVDLFLSPQGIEFCIKNHFPNMSTFRLFKQYDIEKYGIYIDAGTITLKNPNRAVLIGRTIATVLYDKLELHQIVLLHGAKAIVNATKWAVVNTNVESGCIIIKNTADHAIIL